MAKKKAAKKTARKATKKTVRKTKRTAKKQQTMVTVQPPMVDVTADVKENVVPVTKHTSTQTTTSTLAPHEAAAKHEEFTQALTEEPPKRGFWARLFGRK
jgi:hypothetical protein